MFEFENVKQKIIWYEKIIKSYFKEKWKTIKSIKLLEDELFQKEFWAEVDNYDNYTEKFNEYISSKEQELNDIENKKRTEKSKLDIISKKIKQNLELLEEENISLKELNSSLTEYKNTLLNINERFNNNTDKIDELIEWIVKYEKVAKDDINDILEKSKIELGEFFEKEKENILKFLEEKSKKVIDDKYNVEKLKLDQEKKEAFHFEWKIFWKYLLIFFLVFWIATIDFLLVQHIVVEEFDLWRNPDLSIKILVYYIIPFLPSFVLIFWEFLVLKYLKKQIILKVTVHIFSIISVLFIIFTVFFTYHNLWFILVDTINMYDLLSRILIFIIAIPITISILNKFFKTDEFFEFTRHLFLPFIFIVISIKYFFESFILRNKKNKLLKESFTYKLDLSQIDLFIKKDHRLDGLLSTPRIFGEDLNQVSIKTEKALDNIKKLQAFLSKDDIEDNKIWFFSRLFWKKQGNINIVWTLDWKIERLKENIKIIGKDIEEQENIIDNKFQKDINNINKDVSQVKENRKKYKEKFNTNKQTIEDAISEALTELKI